jgi:nucleoside-diphosphate-sugar epimerase
MRALITGATGFVGQNLTKYFSASGISFSTLMRQELTGGDFSKLEKCDAVVHLAGKAHDVNNSSSANEYDHVNFELTRELFDAYVLSDCKKFVFISSVKAYADHIEVPLTEEFLPNPKTPYGLSKLRAEQYMQSVILPPDKTLYILRPCMIHGPGNKGNLNLLYKFISSGIPYPLAAFENKRSFLSIENLCFVIRQILERNDISDGAYQVSDDMPLSTIELVTLIGEALGQKPVSWRINHNLVRTIAKIGDILKLPLTSQTLDKLVENYVVDNTRLKQAIGCDLPIDAREGILKTIRSFNKR